MPAQDKAFETPACAVPPQPLGAPTAPPTPGAAAHRWTRLPLAAAGAMLLILAALAAWLSFQAQAAYVTAHNGGSIAQARAWAVLLDSAAAGASLLRLHEALTARTATMTRLVLAACIAASVTMNILHAPTRAPGALLVAGMPPTLYALLLELLLHHVTRALVPTHTGAVRRAAAWAHFPASMWRTHRAALRQEFVPAIPATPASSSTGAAHQTASALPTPRPTKGIAATAKPLPTTACNGAPTQLLHIELPPPPHAPGATPRRAPRRRPNTKRAAFEAHLVGQLRRGDLRVFSPDHRQRNRAAYDAAAALPAPLSPGTARRYVTDAIPRLRLAVAARTSISADAQVTTDDRRTRSGPLVASL